MNIAFIPARCGSKSIPLKNIKDFCGKPLIYWNLIALQNSDNVDKVFVATDCDKIKTVVSDFNFPKIEVYDRDPENANDIASTESVMLEFIGRNSFKNDDLFILVQSTSPFTTSNDIDKAIEQLKESKSDSLISCAEIKRFFWSKEGYPLNYDYKNRPRRQDFSGSLVENGAIYINTISNIKKYRNRLNGSIDIYIMPEHTMLEIDEIDDWLIAEQLMKKYSNLPKIT